MQNIQIADPVQFLLRRMEPGNWSSAFRDVCAVTAQMDRVPQARVLHGCCYRIALPLLLFKGVQRRQEQVRRARATEAFSERRSIAQVGRVRFAAAAHEALPAPHLPPPDPPPLAL